jgi:hypothetical protein
MKSSVADARKLERLIEQYLCRFAPRRQAEWERFAAMPDLAAAMRDAALARRADGKCEDHQRRVGLSRLEPFEESLQQVCDVIGRCRTFDDLHTIVSERRTEGIGSLTVYDTAVRIGAYLGVAPEKVYLHAGTRKGAKALEMNVTSDYLEPDELLPPLRRLSPDDVENFLCIFKAAFEGRSRSGDCACGHRYSHEDRQIGHAQQNKKGKGLCRLSCL